MANNKNQRTSPAKFILRILIYLPLCPALSHSFYAVDLIPVTLLQQAAIKLNREEIVILKRILFLKIDFRELLTLLTKEFYAKRKCLIPRLIVMCGLHTKPS